LDHRWARPRPAQPFQPALLAAPSSKGAVATPTPGNARAGSNRGLEQPETTDRRARRTAPPRVSHSTEASGYPVRGNITVRRKFRRSQASMEVERNRNGQGAESPWRRTARRPSRLPYRKRGRFTPRRHLGLPRGR
jgi:hypothetical protein